MAAKIDPQDGLPDIFLWKISGFSKIFKDLEEKKTFEYQRKEYFTTQNGLKFRPEICFNIYKYVCIRLNFSVDVNLSSSYLHSRKFVLIDQNSAENNVELIDHLLFKENSLKDVMSQYLSNELFFPKHLLRSKNKYVKNDEILIKIIMEPIAFMWKQIDSQDGVFLWRIDDYSKKKRDAIDGFKTCLTSKPFKTSHVGYTAHLQLYLNGEYGREGKYITIYIYFLLGEHDAVLPLPFKCKYRISLIDQSDSPTKEKLSKEYTEEFKEGNPLLGFHYIPQCIVESWKYLKNDSIVIQATLKIV